MESKANRNILGGVCKALSILIKEHEPTKTTFHLIKSQFQTFCDLLQAKEKNGARVMQTGSSYDDLHMCRNLSASEKDTKFFPGTDFDFMMVYNEFMVEDFTGIKKEGNDAGELIIAAKLSSDSAFIMIPSDHLGYVRLVVTNKGRQMLLDRKSKLLNYIDKEDCLTNDAFKEGCVTDDSAEIIYSRVPKIKYISSGPAISNYEHEAEGYTYDFVHAFPCGKWPEIANRWNKRPRDASWPKEDLRNEIIKDGCAVVPVGYYTSCEQKREWRLSFNTSERKISLSLTENQKICYCLVKLLIKTQLSPEAVLSSYMVKNMMFWFCEQMYGEAEWEDEQLGERIIEFISYICTALEHKHIPHYFLPYNNLISHKKEEDIQQTLVEVTKVKTSPFQTLANVCRKMRVFEVAKDSKDFLSTGGEVQVMLSLSVSSVQFLTQLGLINYDTPDFALKCFKTVVYINRALKPYLRQASNLFAAASVPELLKPFAIQYMQKGQVVTALTLFQLMFNADKKLVIERFPDTISNIACLYANKIDLVTDETEKEDLLLQAEKYFKLALEHVVDSPSLHLAYGSFLKDRKSSCRAAVIQFKKAAFMEKKRDDDDALIQMSLPGEQAGEISYIPGNVVALYNLIDTQVDIDEIFEARMMAKKFEQISMELEIENRRSALQLCSYSFRKLRLHVKASILMETSKTYKKYKSK